eukprot:5346069-Pleurochrysis_carterae.AAC.1
MGVAPSLLNPTQESKSSADVTSSLSRASLRGGEAINYHFQGTEEGLYGSRLAVKWQQRIS